MIVAVIADTHLPRGSRRLPDSCLRRIAAADLLIHAGDFSTAAAYEEIAAIGPQLVGVHGNVDDETLRRRLPSQTVIELAGARLGVIHDAGPRSGRAARMRRAFPDADAVVFGHSHQPLIETADGFQIFNPGSPTERRRAPTQTMGVLEAESGELRFRHLRVD